MSGGPWIGIIAVLVFLALVPTIVRLSKSGGVIGDVRNESESSLRVMGRYNTREWLTEFLREVRRPVTAQYNRCIAANEYDLPAERARLVRLRDEALAEIEKRRREAAPLRTRRILKQASEDMRAMVDKALRDQQA
jgi:hypothetical protein